MLVEEEVLQEEEEAFQLDVVLPGEEVDSLVDEEDQEVSRGGVDSVVEGELREEEEVLVAEAVDRCDSLSLWRYGFLLSHFIGRTVSWRSRLLCTTEIL